MKHSDFSEFMEIVDNGFPDHDLANAKNAVEEVAPHLGELIVGSAEEGKPAGVHRTAVTPKQFAAESGIFIPLHER